MRAEPIITEWCLRSRPNSITGELTSKFARNFLGPRTYFFTSAGQFSTSVVGSAPSFRFPLFSRNFLPSPVTSKAPYSR